MLSISDIDWWFSEYAEFEDFVGIGAERVYAFVLALQKLGVSQFICNRFLAANGLPHGPRNIEESFNFEV